MHAVAGTSRGRASCSDREERKIYDIFGVRQYFQNVELKVLRGRQSGAKSKDLLKNATLDFELTFKFYSDCLVWGEVGWGVWIDSKLRRSLEGRGEPGVQLLPVVAASSSASSSESSPQPTINPNREESSVSLEFDCTEQSRTIEFVVSLLQLPTSWPLTTTSSSTGTTGTVRLSSFRVLPNIRRTSSGD